MNTNKQTVVQRFWDRVFHSPDGPALLVPNTNTAPVVVVSGVAGMGLGGPTAVVVKPQPYLDVNVYQMGVAVATVAAYLKAHGFEEGDRAAVLAWNCPEWVIADLAIQSIGGVTVPIYPHSTPEQVNYVLADSGARFVFSNEEAQLRKVGAKSGVTTVHFNDIVEAVDPQGSKEFGAFLDWFHKGNIPSCPESWPLVAAQLRDFERVLLNTEIDLDRLATIIYTSGSTGTPKGVMLTHGSFAAACKGMLAHGFDLKPHKDVYLSYLPLAHVYERAAGAMLCLWSGIPMAFCKVDEVGETLKKVRPTLLHGVPAVWRKINEKIIAGITEQTAPGGLEKKLVVTAALHKGDAWGWFTQNLVRVVRTPRRAKRKLITWAFYGKKGAIKRWLADKLVFKKIRKQLGGRLRICTSGGAPISPELLAFYQKLGLQVLQGYGLTETTGASVVNRPDGCGDGICNKPGSVGQVVEGLELRIAPLPGQEATGEGEIQFRGPTVTTGYWKLPEETAKTFTEDGWFKTGDKGRIDEDGFLFITGRIKRLLKTDGGKYVAPEKIEKAFETEPIVHYIVAVGDGKPFICGLVFVNQAEARAIVVAAGTPIPEGGNLPAFYASHPNVIAAVERAREHANEKLERWETIKIVRIIPDEATIAAGLLTPTLKIRTEEVLKRNPDWVTLYDKPAKS
jgi:long-chain acyl-CoA synthetase